MLCKICGHEIGENRRARKKDVVMHLRRHRGLELFTVSCQAEGCECVTAEERKCESCVSFCDEPITGD